MARKTDSNGFSRKCMLVCSFSLLLLTHFGRAGCPADGWEWGDAVDGICPDLTGTFPPTTALPTTTYRSTAAPTSSSAPTTTDDATTLPPPETTLPPVEWCPTSAVGDGICKSYSGHSLWFGDSNHKMHFEPNSASFIEEPSTGTATLSGWVSLSSKPGWGRWWLYVRFSGYVDKESATAWPPHANSPKKELHRKCYGRHGNKCKSKRVDCVDTNRWRYYTAWMGWMVEFQRGSDITQPQTTTGRYILMFPRGPPAQVGLGASGKNVKEGLATWFSWILLSRFDSFPPPIVPNWNRGDSGHGDINIDMAMCSFGNPFTSIWHPTVNEFCDGLRLLDTARHEVYPAYLRDAIPPCNPPPLLDDAVSVEAERASDIDSSAVEPDTEPAQKARSQLLQTTTTNCSTGVAAWLATDGAVVLDQHASGFVSKDTLQIHILIPRKYDVNNVTLFVPNEIVEGPVEDNACLDRYTVTVPWAKFVAQGENAVEQVEHAGERFLEYTGAAHAALSETLSAIRGSNLTRTIHAELLFVILFPTTTSAHLGSISVSYCAHVKSKVIFTAVDISWNSELVLAKITLGTSTRWPFRLFDPELIPLGGAADFFEWVHVEPAAECGDPRLDRTRSDSSASSASDTEGEYDTSDDDGLLLLTFNSDSSDGSSHSSSNDGHTDSDSSPDNEGPGACCQEWTLTMRPKFGVCNLDGEYRVAFRSECHESYEEITGIPCPIIPGVNDVTYVDFVLDSDDFCPDVADNIDVTSEVSCWRDSERTTRRTDEFRKGDKAYFKLHTWSSKADVVHTDVSSVDLYRRGFDYRSIVVEGFPSTSFRLNELEWNHGPDYSDEAWFEWLVDGPLDPPGSASIEYAVAATARIVFRGRGGGSDLLERKEDGENDGRRKDGRRRRLEGYQSARLMQATLPVGSTRSQLNGGRARFVVQPALPNVTQETVRSGALAAAEPSRVASMVVLGAAMAALARSLL